MSEFDFVIVGSGFGGSVSAYHLSRKGYRVAVLETGRRWRTADFPKTNWNLRRYLWAPRLGCFGPQRITLLKGVLLLHGSGVGGGSLVYANTLMRPDPEVFRSGEWPRGIDWARELEGPYGQAERMLGVTENPRLEAADEELRKLGEDYPGSTFHRARVGVFFGEPGVPVPDPYFGGEGPDRTGCTFCGGCMVGCRVGAKNTLDLNYLYLAEKAGCRIFPETRVTGLHPEENGYRLETVRPGWWSRRGPVFRARKVILAAGVLGTVELLLRNRDRLPRLSPRLGERVRTNGESLLGSTSFEAHRDYSRGLAIGAALHLDAETRVEAVRYPTGSSAMRLLGCPLTGPGNRLLRPLKLLANTLRRLPRVLWLWTVRDWAKQSIILLVMQTVDRRMRLSLGRSLLGSRLRGRATDKPIPSYLPVAQRLAERLGERIGGEPQNVSCEVALGTPATAHVLGGCCLGEDPQSGVVDAGHEVFGHPGLYVCDGSVIPCNLGVNPSLTITALAERFASRFPPAEEGKR